MTMPPESPSGADDVLSLAAGFPQVEPDAWADMAAAVVNKSRADDAKVDGPGAVEILTSELPGGLGVDPIYWSRERSLGLPGAMPFTRGLGPRDPDLPWHVCQLHDDPDAATSRKAVLDDLERGVSAVWLHVGDDGIAPGDVAEVLGDVMVDLAPVTVSSWTDQAGAAGALIAAWEAKGVDPAVVGGSLGHDPIGLAAAVGGTPDLAPLADAVDLCTNRWTGVRAITVDTRVHHDAGASDQDEIALALATALDYVRHLTDAGVVAAEAFRRIEFRIAATADQFVTIAKLRALRRTWARIGEVLQVPQADRGARVHAVTSWRMQTRTDPWVNILRDTIACLAASAGGADAITVLPYDHVLGLPTPFSRRIARNTQSILASESNVARVADPAGGSNYVETLTDDLARAAWSWFGELDAAGGAAAGLSSGAIAERLARARAARDTDLATLELPLTGTSTFPLAGEKLLERTPRARVAARGLPRSRDGQVFEDLRARTATGDVSVPVFALGSPREHTTRVSFVANLLGVAGVRPETHVVATAEDVAAAVEGAKGASVAILASSKKGYEALAEPTVAALRAAGVDRVLVAGSTSEVGDVPVDGEVRSGMDVVAFLDELLDLLDQAGAQQAGANA
ncbi:methylmalonyl-CoA mutase subunit beta [Janibacter cremeus]|uniref:Methylmalonyl-CoA mutase n=1 Tax=Janibacter cremeus TaxID=1285192 RepID=A0A852VQ68_9MICO|nr:methylmalonyl-CoA mutase family protein [Janibacter cremeus]NYF97610.1 methylmalonyl-CoA mutase [Janibacter cremeus]